MNTLSRPIRSMAVLSVLIAGAMAGCTTIHPQIHGDAPAAGIFEHTRLTQVLNQYVDPQGLVDYRGLQAAPDELEAYYGLIARYSPDSHPEHFPGRHHQLAYWINAYNAYNVIIHFWRL